MAKDMTIKRKGMPLIIMLTPKVRLHEHTKSLFGTPFYFDENSFSLKVIEIFNGTLIFLVILSTQERNFINV